MVPPNNLGPDLNGKAVNETQYRGFDLKGYSDSDYVGCNMDMKSTSGACQLLGGKLVCWSAKKQQFVAMSSAKAEYVAAVGCCAYILWMKSQLIDYDIIYEKLPIFCDNTSAIAISNNLVLHLRTKHIDIRYHFIRDHVLKGDIELHFIPNQYQLADIFTKPLDEPTFKRLIVELEELVTLDKPESPNPFLRAIQVEFIFEEIAFTTNNEVALLYPSHPNQEYFKDVSDFISKCCLKEAFTRSPTQYKEYLCEFWYTAKALPNSKIWVSTPIGEVRGEIGITMFRNTLRSQYLPHLSKYVSPPSISIVRPWFATIGYNGEIKAKQTLKKSCLPPRWRLLMGQIIQCLVDYAKIIWEDLIHKLNKKTREKIVPYPRFISLLLEHMVLDYDKEELTINPTQVFSVYNWILKPNKPEEPPFTDHMKAIYNLDVPIDSKAPKSSSQTKEVPQGKNLRAKSELKRKQSSKHTSESTTKGSKSQTNKKWNLSPVWPRTRAQAILHLPHQCFFHLHYESALGHDASVDSTAEADPRISAPKDSISSQQDMVEGTKNYSFDHIFARSNISVLVDKTKSNGDGLQTAHTDSGAIEESRADDILLKVKLEDLSDILKDTRSAFFTLDSLPDEPIIISDESEEEEEVAKDKETEDT
ncbi:hypothetical protein Tco_0859837 [Tanacetum coccineum]|uniref:Retrovirus-related Pol polyprotein from transposon TNT 1-94 n=1 Tax=Tanacetum coccineum TaxID=301880 RepID=A0ABQ5BD65_9ASTR